MLTVDLQVLGQRHCDIKNGMTVPPELTLKNVIDIATKPAWALGIARGKRKTFGNLAGHVGGMENVNSLAHWIADQFDRDDELEGRRMDQEPLARQTHPQGHSRRRGRADRGEDRRGGARRLQSRRPPARRRAVLDLRAAADRRRGRRDIEVLFDGGIRSGQDVLRALALGARACLIGRAYIYGLGAAGEAGVARAIEIMRNELDVSMALTGVTSIAEIDRRGSQQM